MNVHLQKNKHCKAKAEIKLIFSFRHGFQSNLFVRKCWEGLFLSCLNSLWPFSWKIFILNAVERYDKSKSFGNSRICCLLMTHELYFYEYLFFLLIKHKCGEYFCSSQSLAFEGSQMEIVWVAPERHVHEHFPDWIKTDSTSRRWVVCLGQNTFRKFRAITGRQVGFAN